MNLSTRCRGAVLCGTIALFTLPSPASSQNKVQGATLGVTTIEELRSTRGEPAESGRTNDGWWFISFGQVRPQYTYYYSGDDSVVEWARVFVIDGYSARRVHEAFGRADTTEFGDDLSKQELFKHGQVIVSYKPNGDVNYIEYHPDLANSIGVRRANRAVEKCDSVIAEAIVKEHPAVAEDQALDSVKAYRDARSKIRNQKSGRLLARAARLDSLSAQVDCAAILSASRAFDAKP
jgi:hypothetical protein